MKKLLVQSYLPQLRSCWLLKRSLRLLGQRNLLQSQKNLLLLQMKKPLGRNCLQQLRSCWLLRLSLKPLGQMNLLRLQSCWLLLRN